MPGVKREIDIEQLVQWAYRDELAKETTSSAEGIWDTIGRGGIIDGGGGAQRYDFGVPDPDAIAIGKAVTQLEDLIVDWDVSREALMGDMAAILVARDVLLVRPMRTAALVTMHAKMGTRPDWHDEQPWPGPVPSAKDPAKPMLVGECRGRNLYSTGSYCPLRWRPSPITIALARAEYAAWHRGLATLCSSLTLERHVPLPPAAPAQPWLGQGEPVRRIYAVGEHTGGSPRPLKPQRPVAGPSRRQGEGQRPSPVRWPLDKGAKT